MKHTIVTHIKELYYDDEKKHYQPYIEIYVCAGFPSPAGDYIERPLDLTEHLIQHPSSTYYIRVSGDSMIDYGIFDRDLLIVDRSLNPGQGDIVIAALDGELTCKCLTFKNGIPYLKSGNPDYPSIEIKDKETYIWGVVIHNIHTFRNRHK
ncbi:LexA family protein [Commensalibacter nepenthis]|uniref:Translesion error-prone DNA polymerase V autoproteolytic subunit n=1 Tax=Commensalibacter nepenthis TaxID=3043872 RepID=A0ABT6Q4D3_9PROT|nr:translesion error-prone DNA polymerase V autoproteolytic subunit [Commensalibacter sp. TBRC 10068]MDI2111759.1 translesion error-prone DNA polymerase V autoproteolytic subunit [Commensalibacter sp. TBRC 10068]